MLVARHKTRFKITNHYRNLMISYHLIERDIKVNR